MFWLRMLAIALTGTFLAGCVSGSHNATGNITAFDAASESQKICIGEASYIKGEVSVWYTLTFNSRKEIKSLHQAFKVASTEKEGLKTLDISFEDIHLYAVGGGNQEHHTQLRSNLYQCAKQHPNVPHLQRFYQSRPSNMIDGAKSPGIQGTRMIIVDSPSNGFMTVKLFPSGKYYLKNIDPKIVEWHSNVLNFAIKRNPKVKICLKGVDDERNEDASWNPRLSYTKEWKALPIMTVFVMALAERIPAKHLLKVDGCYYPEDSVAVN